jgi:hypothetical protein
MDLHAGIHRGQINALDRVQRKAAQCTNHTKNSKPRLCVGQQHDYEHFLKHTLGNGLGKLDVTGCEGLTICAGLITFGKLGTGSKKRISG